MGKYKIFKKKEKDEKKEENNIENRKARKDVFDEKKVKKYIEKENIIDNVSKTFKHTKNSFYNIGFIEKLILTFFVTILTSWFIRWM